MDNKIKEAFDEIHADNRLKENTKRFVQENMEKKRNIRYSAPRWKPLYAAVCLVLLFALGGCYLYFTPTSIISMDINPSIELKINRFDRVIGIEGYNDDGKDLVKTLNVFNDEYSRAIDEIMESEMISNCLSKDEFLSVSVVEIDDKQSKDILQYVTETSAGHKNVGCYSLKSEEVHPAHSMGLSYGKYKMYLEIQTYDPQITPQQVNEMTMRELKNMLYELQSDVGDLPDKADPQEECGEENSRGSHGKNKGCRGNRKCPEKK